MEGNFPNKWKCMYDNNVSINFQIIMTTSPVALRPSPEK